MMPAPTRPLSLAIAALAIAASSLGSPPDSALADVLEQAIRMLGR